MKPMIWKDFEYKQKKRRADWFLAVGIIAAALIITAVINQNILFAVFIMISAFTLLMYAARKPRLMKFEINEKGVLVEDIIYTYKNLKSFCIRKKLGEAQLVLESDGMLAPHITIPLSNKVNIDEVHEFLSEYLKEEEHPESVSEIVMDRLGF
ncbi:hypothetical protein ACFLY0_02230 [Patescibacteria group bacterium]